MSEVNSVQEQLQGIEVRPPLYDYDGLVLPYGLIVDASFGSHSNVGDLDEVRKDLAAHDVIVHEYFGWDAPTLKLFERIVKGDYIAREKMLRQIQLNKDGVSNQLDLITGVKAVYGANRPILVIDPPEKHRVVEKISGHHHGGTMYFSPDFDTAVAGRKKEMINHAELNLERENYMLRSFSEQVSNVATRNPKLATKIETGEGLSVVMFDFGLTHSGLYAGLQKIAENSGFELGGSVSVRSGPDYLLHYEAQAQGRYLHGVEIDDLLAAKDLLSKVISHRVLGQSQGDDELSVMSAMVLAIHQVDSLSLEELRATYASL